MNGIIYKAISPNGKCYIGQSTEFEQRKINHRSASLNENSKEYDHYFHRAIRKYGWENIKWEILIDGLQTQDQLNAWEKVWIDLEKSNNVKFGYNMTEGGDKPPINKGGNHCIPHTEETKRKISENKERAQKISKALKGKKKSKIHKENISKSMIGKIGRNKGKKFSKEWKENLSNSHKGNIPWNKGIKQKDYVKSGE